MKKLFIATLVLITTSSFAGLDKGVREATLRVNKHFDLVSLDPIGSIVENRKTGELLINHCAKRDESQECERIIHILKTDDKSLVLHNRRNLEISQSVNFLKYRLEMKYGQSIVYFEDFDPRYQRTAGDFTSYIGGVCIYEPGGCKLLVLLPLTIAADLVMLPLDVSVDVTQKIITRHKAKLFVKNLEAGEDKIELSNRAFLSMLKSLAQF